jgi:MFS family permease
LERTKYTDWARHLSEWIPRVAELKLRLTALGIAGAVFALGALLWLWRKPSPRYTTAAFLAFAIMPLGICWTHYFVFAIPLAALCTLDARSPYLLRAVGVLLLLVLLDLTNIVWVTPEMQAVFAVAPPSFPLLQALPMIMVGIVCVAAMALAPREPAQERG